jgi:hydroxymethylglutaryl-CoA reductase
VLGDIARREGAFGATLTGGGGGGCMFALTPSNDLQEKVARAMAAQGFEVLRTKVGVQKL